VDADLSVVGDYPLESARHTVEASLARLGIADPVVRIRLVESIPRLSGSLKLKRFVPMD
jgi:hypothetical protein